LQIVTFSTIKGGRPCAARVLGYPYAVGDKVLRPCRSCMGRDTPLRACLELQPKHADGYKMAPSSEMRDRPRRRKVVLRARGPAPQDGIHAAR
jgi:hypothetical protein